MSAPYTLVLLRHGQSTWNQQNLFTGWVDVRLSEQGATEAARAGVLLKDAGLLPDVLHTSLLSRAIQTANLALEEADLWEVDPGTGRHRIFASGLRNPVGMAWETESGALWVAVNERDELGTPLPWGSLPREERSCRSASRTACSWDSTARGTANRAAATRSCSSRSQAGFHQASRRTS